MKKIKAILVLLSLCACASPKVVSYSGSWGGKATKELSEGEEQIVVEIQNPTNQAVSWLVLWATLEGQYPVAVNAGPITKKVESPWLVKCSLKPGENMKVALQPALYEIENCALLGVKVGDWGYGSPRVDPGIRYGRVISD